MRILRPMRQRLSDRRLGERLTIKKSVPLDTEQTDTTCSYCSVGCSLHLETYGDMLVKAVPDKEGAVNRGFSAERANSDLTAPFWMASYWIR
jgi:anaerobic selenocysteine-containing dehydrogenase